MNRITQEAHARQRYLEYYLKHGNGTETAIRYKISRKTLYKWLKRYDGTWQSVVERSRRPKRSPRAHTPEEIRQIRRLAKKHHWEDLILAYQEMREKYGYRRSYGGFKRIVAKLKAAKGNKRRKARKNKPYQRAEYPGQKGSGGREVRACRVCGGWRKILPVHGCGRVHTLDLSADVR